MAIQEGSHSNSDKGKRKEEAAINGEMSISNDKKKSVDEKVKT